jgi:hypothetical protein
MHAMTRLSLAAWAYPSVAPTDHPIEPYCIWNSYLFRATSLELMNFLTDHISICVLGSDEISG